MLWVLLLAIFGPVVLSPLLFAVEKYLPKKVGVVSSSFSVISFICFVYLAVKLDPSTPDLLEMQWVPVANVNLSFLLDGLSMFFGFLVTGIGVLVNLYANQYMDPKQGSLTRFYFVMNLFTMGMLGCVFANNLLLTFCFWEITGITSYFIIGYYYQEKDVPSISRMIFLLTSMTSLCLLVGILLMGNLYGTYRWTEIVSAPSVFMESDGLSIAILLLFLGGIFGKSAQIPFHFWLPNAMIAPTPASAYLHAATMVKLGVYLTARMFPLFVLSPLWFPIVTSVCYLTMLVAAVLSLLSNDMKRLLAYATVSQLGFFIGFYGMGNVEGVNYDFVHILNHALYKGSLFMLAGIVYKATHIRDIRHLGGLRKRMPFTMWVFLLATAAMIGIPGTTGFLSKELIISDVVLFGKAHLSGLLILIVLLTALIVKVAFSVRLFYYIFHGEPKREIKDFQKQSVAIHIPPLVLSLAALIFGMWPEGLQNLSETFFVSGLHNPSPEQLAIWHGWGIEFALSLAVLVMGGLLFYVVHQTEVWWTRHPIVDVAKGWQKILDWIGSFSVWVTEKLFTPPPDRSLQYLFSLLTASSIFYLLLEPKLVVEWSFDEFRTGAVIAMILSTLAIPFFKKRLSKVIALSTSGFFVTLLFVLFKAPDLAMTQLLVDVVTIFIVLVLIWKMGVKHLSVHRVKRVEWGRLVMSVGVGLTASIVTLSYHGELFTPYLQNFFTENTYAFTGMTNMVNAILVDFRAFDTLGEVTVLVIAVLGVTGLVVGDKPPWTVKRSNNPVIPSLIFDTIFPYIFFVINVLAIYLFFRGEEYPGGGFDAGLLAGMSLIILSLCLRIDKILKMVKINIMMFTFVGLLFMLIASVLPLLSGYPLLTHQIPFVNETPWITTTLLFEVGVFLVVFAMSVQVVYAIRGSMDWGKS